MKNLFFLFLLTMSSAAYALNINQAQAKLAEANDAIARMEAFLSTIDQWNQYKSTVETNLSEVKQSFPQLPSNPNIPMLISAEKVNEIKGTVNQVRQTVTTSRNALDQLAQAAAAIPVNVPANVAGYGW